MLGRRKTTQPVRPASRRPGMAPFHHPGYAAIGRMEGEVRGDAFRDPGTQEDPKPALRTAVRKARHRGRHGLLPLAALAALPAAAEILHAAGTGAEGALIGAGTCAACALLTGAKLARSRPGWVYAGACAALSGGWMAWGTAEGVSRPVAAALVLGWLAAVLPWWNRHRSRHDHSPACEAPPELPPADEMLKRLRERVCGAGGPLAGASVVPLPPLQGARAFLLRLVPGKQTVATATNAAAQIASAAEAPLSRVVVEATEGDTPGERGPEHLAKLTVLGAQSVMHEIQEFDGPTLDRSTGLFAVGPYPDGTPAWARLYKTDEHGNPIRAASGIASGSPGSGKALALDTLIPTPHGWTTMGEVRRGDEVFDESGSPCRVTEAWPVRHGRPCFKMQFSDGSEVVADAEHLWLAETRKSRQSGSNAKQKVITARRPNRRYATSDPVVVTTAQMLENLTVTSAGVTHANYSIRLASPLCCPKADLPIPPYMLGAWLGDGASAGGSITSADPEIISEVASEMRAHLALSRPTPEEVGAWPAQVPIEEAARALGMARTTAYVLAKTGRFPAHVIRAQDGHCPAGHPYDATQTNGSPACSECRRETKKKWTARRETGGADTPRWPLRRRRVMVDTVSLVGAMQNQEVAWAMPGSIRGSAANYTIAGLTPRLRAAGLLRDKRIPVQYLRASEEQRRALLAGLLDTDGSCARQGTVEFYSTKERLARDVLHLAASLGYKPTLRSKPAKLNGNVCGTAWTVAFTPPDKVFRLPRKLSRQKTQVRDTTRRRYVTSITPVPSVPVRCIAVDSPSHLFLAGETCIPTHNSRFAEHKTLEHLASGLFKVFLLDGQGGASIPGLIEHVDWAALRPAEWPICLRAAVRLMIARTRRQASRRMPHWAATPEDPFVQIVIEEAHKPLRDPVSLLAVKALAQEGEKVGIGVDLSTQFPSQIELGGASGTHGANALRDLVTAGNVTLFRTGGKFAKAHTVGEVNVSPHLLPQRPGMCFVLGASMRTSPVRAIRAADPSAWTRSLPQTWLSELDIAALDGDEHAYTERWQRFAAADAEVDAESLDMAALNAEVALMLGLASAGVPTAPERQSKRTAVQGVWDLLCEHGSMKRADLIAALGQYSGSSVDQALGALERTGKVRKGAGHGVWELADAPGMAGEG